MTPALQRFVPWIACLWLACASIGVAIAGGYGFFAPDLIVSKSHSGHFFPGQAGANYTIVVTNSPLYVPFVRLPTAGVVTVVDDLPAAMTATSIGGAGWSCTLATLTCTRADSLAGGDSYPPVTVTVSVAGSASGTLVNAASVSGGGEPTVYAGNNTALDATTIAAPPAQVPVPAMGAAAIVAAASMLALAGAAALRSRRTRRTAAATPASSRPA